MATPKIKMTDFFKKVSKDEAKTPKDETSKMTDFFKVIPKDESSLKTEIRELLLKPQISTPKDETAVSPALSEASSDLSDDIVEVIQNNKRKRVEEEINGGSSSKRRSEEPLVNLNSVKKCVVKINSVKKHLGFSEEKDSSDEVEIVDEKVSLKSDQNPGETGAKSPKATESDDENDSEEEWEVEEIINYEYCKESDQGLYYVKWLGWASEDNTWEPEANLECAEKLADFYKARLLAREKATPAEKRKLQVPPDPRKTFEIRQEYFKANCPEATKEELLEQYRKELKFNKGKGGKRPLIPIVAEPIFNGIVDQICRSYAPKEKQVKFVKEQLLARQLRDYREKQIRDIKSWENLINSIDKNSAKIMVENEVDLDWAPKKMKYINQYVASEGIEIPDDPPIGCECTSCEVKTEKNCCPGMNGHNMAYTKHAKLRIDVGTPIWECNKKCACTTDCYNRVVQGGRKHKLCIYKTENGCGWGVKALENIKAGSFVVDYVGEVISEEEAADRGKKYDAEGMTYLFDLDFNRGQDNKYTVDAAFMGNISHFVNHSCDPNMHIFNVYINCLDPDLPQICFFARREIKKGEPLTFDYCQNLNKATDNSEDEDDARTENILASPFSKKTPSKKVQTECRCGAPRCRKQLF